jgi:thymidylate synthase (FAD)
MKIVKPSVTLVHATPDPERVIERMGRICYQSNHKVKVCEPCGGEGKRVLDRSIIEPPLLREPGDEDVDSFAGVKLSLWGSAMEEVEQVYLEMLDEGISPQIARSVLPNSLKTEIGMTANFREWRHFLSLRTSPKAHPQMREIAEMLRAELLKISSTCFSDIQ